MKKLSPEQLNQLRHHLIRTGSTDALLDELVDHLACEVERYLWLGQPFELALQTVVAEANAKAVEHLRAKYQTELTLTDEQLRQASLDDIVFQFRNKAYGAYDLRRAYRTTLRNAFIMAIGLCLMLMSGLNAVSHHTWSYTSGWGLAWIVGLAGVTFAGVSWYLQHIRQQYQPERP